VPRFEPFPALRYAADPVDSLIAPPYDVLSDADVDELAERHPHNVVHVDVPREAQGAGRYERAGRRFRDWIADGVLVADPEPSFTLYRMRFDDATGARREIVGVVGGLEVVDEGAGGVLPHERTTPKASTDRLDLTRATEANLSPVWGLSLARGLTSLLAAPGEPIASVSVDGAEHVVERVTDASRIDEIRHAVASDDVLMADGHHRYGVARMYRDEVRAATGRTDTPAELTLAFVGELIAEQLSVEAIHRLYSGIGADRLRELLSDRFELEPAPAPSRTTLADMNERGSMCLVTRDGAAWLTPRPGAFEGVRALDGLWLEHVLDGSGAEVTYQHGLDEVVRAVRDGRAEAAVLIRPVSVAEIERTAREGLLMPPKSTFFTPKLRTGFVFRSLA
jgi:uncharacterized protein (DUF1015 family)